MLEVKIMKLIVVSIASIFVLSIFISCTTTLPKKNIRKTAVTSPHKVRKKSKLTVLAGSCTGFASSTSLDHIDKEYMMRNAQHALDNAEIGQVKQWRNTNSYNFGSVKPITEKEAEGDKHCRKYIHSLTVNGKTEQTQEKACRQEDGTWLASR
jgi:surface antigen